MSDNPFEIQFRDEVFTPTPTDLARDLRRECAETVAGLVVLAAAGVEIPDEARTIVAALRRAVTAEAKLASTYCAYCGFTVAVDEDASRIAEHIRTCAKHPMRDVEAEVARLKHDLDHADRTLADCEHTLAEQARRIEALEAALLPFAQWWVRFGPEMTDEKAHAMFAQAAEVLGMEREEGR